MSSFSTIDHIIEIIFASIDTLFILPFIAYSAYKLHQHINELYFTRRGKNITIAWFISLSIYNLMLIIIILSHFLYDNNHHISEFIFFSPIATTIHHMIGSSSIWMNLSRCWQLYYNKKYYHALQSAKWRNKINQNDINFYVKHRSTLGNYKTIYSIATVLWILDGFIF